MASTLAPPTLEASQQVTDTMRPTLAYMKRRHALGHLALAVAGVLAAAAIGCMLAGDNAPGLVAAALVALGLSAWWTR